MRRTVGAVVVALSLVLGACGGGSGAEDGEAAVQAGKTEAEARPSKAVGGRDVLPDGDIELTTDTVVVRSNGGNAVRSFGADGHTIVIDADADGADRLEPGKILLLTGVTVVRVASIERDGDELTIEGEPVTLPEVIHDGELDWESADVDPDDARMMLIEDSARGGPAGTGTRPPVNVPGLGGGGIGGAAPGGAGGLQIPTDEQLGEELGDINDILSGGSGGDGQLFGRPTPRLAGKAISGQIPTKFDFDIDYGRADGSHLLDVQIRPKSDLTGTIDLDVKIKSLAHSGAARITGGKVESFDFNLSDMSGEALIETNLRGLENVARLTTPPFFKLPFSIEFPALVGGIPFTLGVGGSLQVNLSMALANSSLTGKSRITFDGPAGFHLRGLDVSLDGKRTQESFDLLETLKGAAPGPVGIVVTTEMPKVTFGFGFLQTGAGLFIANGMVASQHILPPPAVCTAMNVAYVLAAGAEAKFLGKEIEIARKPFVDKRWNYQAPNDGRCNADKK